MACLQVYHEGHSLKEKKEGEKTKTEDANWLAILEDYEKQKYFHKYSPEKNGVIRKAPKLDVANADVPSDLADKTKKVVNKIQEKKPSIVHSEATYNYYFVFRLMDVLFDEFDGHEASPFSYLVDHRKIYKADGIVCDKYGLELMLLETAGAFKNNDSVKAAFDNSKGMFALLAMLKTIADKYGLASFKSFKKLKLLFLQPSDCYLRLWQMKYDRNGCYEYVRVAKAVVNEEKSNKDAYLNSLNQFVLKMKKCLNETLEAMKRLEEEHEAKKLEADSEDCSQRIYLSDVICPKILKISFGQHSKGFAKKEKLSPDNK